MPQTDAEHVVVELDQPVASDQVEWIERIPWDENMKEVEVELPDIILPLLKHNNPPTSEDIHFFKEYQNGLGESFTSVETRIQSVTSMIDVLQEELRNLERERIGYTKQSHACDIVCSPIRTLPPELVQEIAFHLRQSVHHIINASHNPLLLMSKVCSSWRTAIISTPRLWTRFEVDTAYSVHPKDQTNLKTTIIEYSNRAKSLPLDVQVILSDLEFRGLKHEISHKFLSWLLSEWPSINLVRRLHVTSFRFLEVLATELKDPAAFDSLERLAVVCGRSRKPIFKIIVFDDDTKWGNLFTNAPRLCRLSIGRNSLGEHLDNLHFPFTQITHLFLAHTIPFSHWASLLEKFSALQFGFFVVRGYFEIDHAAHGSPCLQDLKLTLEDFSDYSDFLTFIQTGNFPMLSHLELHIASCEGWSRENISSWAPNLPFLKNLSLFFNQDAPFDTLLSVLRASPNITTLELGLPASQWGPLFTALTLEDENSQLLPILSSLVIQALVPFNTLSWAGTYFDMKPCQELIDMVLSRFVPPDSPSAPLDQGLLSVYLFLVQHPNYKVLAEETLEALLPCVKAGLSFQICNIDQELEDKRYNSCLSTDWETFVPNQPPSYVQPRIP